MKSLLLILIATMMTIVGYSQNCFWRTSTSTIQQVGYVIQTKSALKMHFNIQLFKNRIKSNTTDLILSLPLPSGDLVDFKLTTNTVMSPELMTKYPEIRAFNGVALDKSGKIAKVDVGPNYFRAMILDPNGETIFIDPAVFTNASQSEYIIYSKSDFFTDKVFECNLATDKSSVLDVMNAEKQVQSCELRTYRLAVSATGEYTAFHGGTVANALAAQVTTMNRVNGIYERDFAVTMTIIGNNDLLIYTNAATDPYTNGQPDQMIGQNQSNTTTVIGSANYDIGHVFGTNSGGLAQLACVCKSNVKASGVTGSSAPVNDPFDIDYVAHEMGHQFGANHTFNNSCSGNRNSATAMETGSGSTIMAYAGICSPNVQSNSNDYFHAISLQEIGNNLNSSSHNCPVKTPLNNVAPVVTATSGNMTIPKGTPFSLTATATDANGNTLSYCWEQMDKDISTQAPVATATKGPSFRTYSPVASATRHFPSIRNQVLNTLTWEKLSTVARTYKFRVTVRDNAAGGSCTDFKDLTVTTDANSGPFLVVYPNVSTVTWTGLTTETVTWDVANTTASPVNCQNVKILLSTDGGYNFTTLVQSTPNDGSQAVTVPNIATSQAIIMVTSENEAFFDVSDKMFKIKTSSVGLNTLEEVNLHVYPNPFKDEVTVEFNDGTLNGYRIYSTTGQLVEEATNELSGKTVISVSHLKQGIYFFETSVNGQRKSIKLIKE